jgi:hypothetical protein
MANAARLIATADFARIAFIGIPYDLMKLRPLGIGLCDYYRSLVERIDCAKTPS